MPDQKQETQSTNPLKRHKAIIPILLLALSLRLLYCLVLYPPLLSNTGEELGWTMEGKLAVDPYDKIAKNIISGRGYISDSYHIDYERLPLYIYFLVAVYRIWGMEQWKLQVIQSLLDTISCFIIYLISLRIFKDKKAALLAALAYALYFKMIQVVTSPMTETLYILLLLIYLYFFLLSLKKYKFAFLSGVVLGAITLCKPVTLIFPAAAGIYYIAKLKRNSIKTTVLMFSGFLLLITPLYVRNYLWEGKVFFSTGAGKMLYLGTAIDYSKNFRSEEFRLLKDISSKYSYPYIPEIDRHLTKIAVERIRRNPLGYIKRIFHRIYLFWAYPDFSTQMMAIKTGLVSLFNLIVILLAILGLYSAKKKRVPYQPFLLFSAYFYIIYILIYAYSRYSLPLFPILFIFSSYTLMGFLRKIFPSSHRIDDADLLEDK